MYEGKLNKHYYYPSTTKRLYETFKAKSLMPLPPDTDSVTEELKRITLQC